MLDKRTQKIIDFIKEIEKAKLVWRKLYLSDGKTREDDAQHSWHLAMMIICFKDELGIKFNIGKAIKLALIHDLVEIYTGDDWHTTKKERQVKSANEEISAKKLFGLLPPDLEKEFYDLWKEYEDGETIEAKITKGLDRVAYPMQYSISKKIDYPRKTSKKDARSYAWSKIKFNKKVTEIYDYFLNEMPEKHNPKANN